MTRSDWKINAVTSSNPPWARASPSARTPTTQWRKRKAHKPNFIRGRNAYKPNARASGHVAGGRLRPRPVSQSLWQIDQIWVGSRTAEHNHRPQSAVRHPHDRHPASLMPGHRCLERSRMVIQTRRQPLSKFGSGFDAAQAELRPSRLTLLDAQQRLLQSRFAMATFHKFAGIFSQPDGSSSADVISGRLSEKVFAGFQGNAGRL